jgi:hypothetical protein
LEQPASAANPGRPTVSTPATITPVGYLQFETGFVPAYQSPEFSSGYSLTQAIKLAVAPRLEFLVMAEPVAHFTAEGRTANRVADIFVGTQFVLYRGEGAKPTLAVSYFHRAYDGGAPEFDYGRRTISHRFLRRFTLSGEIWHFTQPFLKSNAVGNLWAISYSARKTLVFDAGFNHGLTGTSTSWEGFVGFTYLFPHRLWKVQ